MSISSESAGTASVDPVEVAERITTVRGRIARAGGGASPVRIVAVTKTFGPAAGRAAFAAGVPDVGENYGSELLATAAAVSEPVRWHFLGSIQRRDAPKLAPLVAIYEGVDRISEGEAIARHAPGAIVYVELETTGIAGRAGVPAGEIGALVAGLRALELSVDGVMTIAPPGGGPEARRAFEQAREVADDLGLTERSMGMSDDLELAVEAGSTAVRIGRALFGGRGPHPRGVTMGV